MGLSVILKICSVSAMWRSVVGSAVIWLQEISRYRRASICISVERERERGGGRVWLEYLLRLCGKCGAQSSPGVCV